MSTRIRFVLFTVFLLFAFASVASADCRTVEIWVLDQEGHWEMVYETRLIVDQSGQWVYEEVPVYTWVPEVRHLETTIECYTVCEDEYVWVVDESAHYEVVRRYVAEGFYEEEWVYIPEQGHWEIRRICQL